MWLLFCMLRFVSCVVVVLMVCVRLLYDRWCVFLISVGCVGDCVVWCVGMLVM